MGAVVVVIAVCAVAVYFSLQYAPSKEKYKISGYVKTDGAALPGVTITVDGKSAVTDSSGYFEVTDLEGNKSYTLNMTKSGYESYSTAVQLGTEDKVISEVTLKTAEIEYPTTAIESALASRYGVSTDNVSIYFCIQAAENDNFATGAVISQTNSIVFIYSKSTGTITVVENEYAATGDEISGMSSLATKETISRFTGRKIVPFGLVKTDGTYTFSYYDGYDMYLKYWGHGSGTLNESLEVTLETHSWS